MDIRKNIYKLTDAELNNFITAVNGLKTDGRYDAFIHRHHLAMDTATVMPGELSDPNLRNAAHRGPSFLPWHRYFIREFELALKTVIAEATLPYWDWIEDAANPTGAALWNTDASTGRVYIGGDGDPANGDRVTTGPFAGWTALLETAAGNLVPRSPPGLIRRLGRDPLAPGNPVFPAPGQLTDALRIDRYDSSPWNASATPPQLPQPPRRLGSTERRERFPAAQPHPLVDRRGHAAGHVPQRPGLLFAALLH